MAQLVVCLTSDSTIVSLSKNLPPYCLVLVDARKGLEHDFKIKLKHEMFVKQYAP